MSKKMFGLLSLVFAVPSIYAAETAADLQAEVSRYLSTPAVSARVSLQTEIFNQKCEARASKESAELIRDLGNGVSLRNYAAVIPGVSRFELPTLAALEAAHDQGLCDEVISLNKECLVEAFDFDASGSLNAIEEKVARDRLGSQSLPKPLIDELVRFYQKGGAICLSPRKNTWHKVLPAREPDVDVANALVALEAVLDARKNGKSVCFHCSYGKHRTGLVAMLVEIVSAPEAATVDFDRLYRRYLDHAWFSECESRTQTMEILPLVIQSKPFLDLRKAQ